ncbi:MAG: secretin N-terminal domain-containing protein [Pseudomonadota bacterium]
MLSVSKKKSERAQRLRSFGAIAVAFALVSACASTERLRGLVLSPNETLLDTANEAADDPSQIETDDGAGGTAGNSARPISASRIPAIAKPEASAERAAIADAPALGVENINVVVPPLALPGFIDLVFGKMLQTPYVTGPGISDRSDIVQLRSSGELPAEVFLGLVTESLKDFGVAVEAKDGAYRIFQSSELQARIPRFVRTRARPQTPAALRPVIQYVELNAISASDMAGILEQAFSSRRDSLRVDAEDQSNFIILNGLPDDVSAALSIIEEMDELRYAGTQVQRYSPLYWSASALSQELNRILTAEGWKVSDNESRQLPVLILAIEQSNDLLIFTRTTEVRRRASFWLRELDRPSSRGGEAQIFTYSVRHLNAEVLAATVNRILAAAPSDTRSRADIRRQQLRDFASGRNQPGDGDPSAATPAATGRLVVDPTGNRIMFSGSASEFDRLRDVLQTLDQPAAEVLIEAAVAQVTLSDSINSGVEWVIQNVGAEDVIREISTGGTGIALFGDLDGEREVTSSFTPFDQADATVDFNALASNSEITLLATPRIVARSGAIARVQVGAEVPTLSSQRLPVGGGAGGNTDVISSVVYRSTGIILEIEPIVFSNDRIDLTVRQEVSSTAPTSGPVDSPTFNNTSVSTQLSLEDGSTAVIGGLIQDNLSESESGVPFLKDVPILGRAFRSEATSSDRTELVILITAYVLRGQQDKTALANNLSREINRTMARPDLLTLRPRTPLLRFLNNEDKESARDDAAE